MVSMLFSIPLIIDIHDDRFDTFTVVWEIRKNIDFVLGIKNPFEFEDIINS